jgi:hypothetical protein
VVTTAASLRRLLPTIPPLTVLLLLLLPLSLHTLPLLLPPSPP